ERRPGLDRESGAAGGAPSGTGESPSADPAARTRDEARDRRLVGMRMAAHFAPVVGEYRDAAWAAESREVVWRQGSLDRALLGVLERRLLRAERDGGWEKPIAATFRAPLAAI